MDMISIRRKLMAKTQSGGIDTSPVIEIYGYKLATGNKAPVENSMSCISKKYFYTPDSANRVMAYYGLGQVAHVLTANGDYMDFWGTYSPTAPTEKAIIMPNSGGMQFTIVTNMLDVCYAYIKATGQILFAGRNSIYYGHRNINELN